MKRIFERFKSLQKKSHVYEVLKTSGVNWEEYAATLPVEVEDPIQYFLNNYNKHPLVISDWFDSKYYLEMNHDVRNNGVNPLVHFLLFGNHEGRPAWNGSISSASPVLVSPVKREILSDAEAQPQAGSTIKQQLKALIVEQDLIPKEFTKARLNQWLDDLLEVSNYGSVKIEGLFDQQLYVAMYPDLASASINAFHHFIMHGFTEGRLGWLDFDELLTEGGVSRDESLATIMVVSHEASATGAPVVALEVARRLGKHYNVVTATLRDGSLHAKFVEAGIAHLDAPVSLGMRALEYCLQHVVKHTGVSAVLLNSVESLDMADAASSLGLPTVSLLHEFADYTRPVGKVTRMLLASDMVIYPADSLLQSGVRELKMTSGIKHLPNHLLIQPQGYIGFKAKENENWGLRNHLGLKSDDLLVVGAGHIQPRKGVDWFLETCFHLREALLAIKDKRANKLKFIWLGGGYDENDTLVSVWLDAYIQRTGLEGSVYFPGAVDDVAVAMRDADLFLLTSKLDPFPNVAVDALQADCGIGAFEQASGIADFVKVHSARAALGRYGDPQHLAQQIAKDFNRLILKNGSNSRICREHLDFDHYVETLYSIIQDAITRRDEVSKSIHLGVFKQHFDADFYSHATNDDLLRQQHFLGLLRKGVAATKPFPGSDIQSVIDDITESQGFEELIDKAMTCRVETMPVKQLTGAGDHVHYTGRIALQFHIYFADLIPEYCDYFKTLLDHNVDLFVSHVPELSDEQIDVLKASVSGSLHLTRVKNLGRDVYPFHYQFVNEIHDKYDVVGHFHTKKSGDNADGVGDRWRRYLLANLLGSRAASGELLSNFNDDKVGLVFAEDSHLVDEGENGDYIVELLGLMGLKRWECYRHFPLGTMFWARTAALKGLLDVPAKVFELSEPVAYDGTVLHAFERILPQIVIESGFQVQRVYANGTYW